MEMEVPNRVRMFAELAHRARESLTPQLMNQLHQQYCVREFKIEDIDADVAIALFSSIANKNHRINYARSQLCWHENELRLFVWTLVVYAHHQQIDLQEMVKKCLRQTSRRWEFFLRLFPSKPEILFEYQCLNLLKKHNQYKKWVHEEDQLFEQLVREDDCALKWSDLAKHLYIRSGRRYFRTPKQCRERWLNHLDPSKLKKYWLLQEDLTLVEFVREHGKKWAAISKKLASRRNEHSIKNRFKSLMTKEAKAHSPNTTEGALVDHIYDRLLAERERKEERKVSEKVDQKREEESPGIEGEDGTIKRESQMSEMLGQGSMNEHRETEKTTTLPEFHLVKIPSHISGMLPNSDYSQERHSDGQSEAEQYRVRADLLLQEDPFEALRQYFNGPR